MKLYYDRKSKDPTYYVQVGIRNGKKTTTKNVARIGKHSELLKITDDPLAYAKEQIAKYNEEAKKNINAIMEVNVNFAEKIKATESSVSSSTLKNIGYLYLEKLYRDLKLDMFFSKASKDRKFTFDPNLVNSFMVYSRILSPDSKLGTLGKLASFYEDPSFDYQHIMRTMDLMEENFNGYIEHLFKTSSDVVKRDTSVCYYDCTNYYCEAETPDEDYVDEVTGEVIMGLRKHGLSKDHKPSPLVEMGLFTDTNGIPISMCIAPGNTNEQTTAIPLEKELVKILGEDRNEIIYCADAGLGSYHIRNFNSMGGRHFVVTQSVKKLSDPLKTAVFNDFDYRRLSNGKSMTIEEMKSFDRFNEKNKKLYDDRIYKVLPANTLLDVGLYEEIALQNGKTKKVKSKATLKQSVIITFSRKTMEYQRFIRNRQIERAKKILENMDPDEYKKGPNDVTRLIKKSGSAKDKYELDMDKIAEEEKYDGFYAIATNLNKPVSEIIAINEQRYKIEECFRILKTNFSSRPYYHRQRRRIIAHFMICYTALLIYRMLEYKIKRFDNHITTLNILETMQSMQVANIEDMCYMSTFTGSKTLTALEAVIPIGLDRKYYKPTELNKKIRKNFQKSIPYNK